MSKNLGLAVYHNQAGGAVEELGGRWAKLSRDAGGVARKVSSETTNALTQQDAWDQAGEVLQNLTEIVVAQHDLIRTLTARVEALEQRG